MTVCGSVCALAKEVAAEAKGSQQRSARCLRAVDGVEVHLPAQVSCGKTILETEGYLLKKKTLRSKRQGDNLPPARCRGISAKAHDKVSWDGEIL